MADTKANRAKLKKRRTEQGEQTAIPKGKSISPGIVKTTRPVQTERRFRGKEQIGDTKTTFKEEFKSKETGERFTGGNVPTVPNFTPLKGLTQENLTELGVENPETIDLENLQRRQALAETAITEGAADREALQKREEALSPTELFVRDEVNTKLRSILEFAGAEFKETQEGALRLTARGAAGLSASALIAGSTAGAGLSAAVGKTASRAVVGKAVSTKAAAKGAAYATNGKSVGLTTRLLQGLGLSLGAAGIAIGVIGTYPFSLFAKEEALQAISFPMNRALTAGQTENARALLDLSNEMVNAEPTIKDKIPYANVQKSFSNYIDAQREANKVWADLIEEKETTLEGGGEDDGRE